MPDYKVGDQVRHVVDLDHFEKGSLSRYSKDVFSIIEKKGNIYKLSDNKWYKYYHLSPINEVVKEFQNKPNAPTREVMKKTIQVKRRLNKEGVKLSDITTTKKTRGQQKEFVASTTRSRKKTDRFHF